MLILTRRVGESVVISDEVYCTILGYDDEVVRLAFDAPKSIPIHRDEIQRRIFRARQGGDWLFERKPSKESVVDLLIRKFKHGIKPLKPNSTTGRK